MQNSQGNIGEWGEAQLARYIQSQIARNFPTPPKASTTQRAFVHDKMTFSTGDFSTADTHVTRPAFGSLAINGKPIRTRTYISADDYGTIGDGIADDTAALQRFLADFVKISTSGLASTKGIRGVIPPGVYKITSKLILSWTNHSTGTKSLEGFGARILPFITSGDSMLIEANGASVNVRNLTISGLTIDGTNATDATASLIHINTANAATGIYRTVIRDLCLEAFVGDGLKLDGASFENAIVNPHFNAAGTNSTGNCLNIINTSGENHIYGGTMFGGLNNIQCVACTVFGGSYISAFNEGILMNNAVNGVVIGAHVENAWQGGVASPGWTTAQAGITILGRGTVIGVEGAQNNNKMRYVVRTNAGFQSHVQGGIALGGVDYYLRLEGGGTTTCIALDQGVTGAIHDFAQGKIIRLGVRGNASPIQIDRGSLQSAKAIPAYSTLITPDASLGLWQTITVTNATAFTINAPGNPPDTTHTQELTIEIFNSSGGAMGLITWNAAFVFAGLVWANPATTKKRRVTFRWNGLVWVATSITSADY